MKSLLFKTFVLAIGLMLMVMLMPIPFVSARAELESCTPAVDAVLTQAPDRVQCTFTEPVDIARSTLAVFDANNNQVDNKDTKLDPADAEGQTVVVTLDKAKLANGVHKVKWATVSKEDQSPAQGEWSFSISGLAGAPAAPTAAPTAPSTAPTAPSAAPTATAPSGAPSGPAQAPAPAAALAFRDDPGAAATFGTIVQSMPARSVQWFSFNYDTAGYQFPRPTVTVRLLNGVTNGLAFEVWSPERMQGGWWENKPVGRGTQQVLPSCDEPEEEGGDGGEGGAPEEGTPPGEEVPPVEGGPEEARLQDQVTGSFVSWTFAVECGKFVTNDLTWMGGFGAAGTYYVRLINPTNAPVIPQMLISGAGVTECTNANLGLPGYGLVPSPDEAFVRVQCIDAGPGLVYTTEEPAPGPEDEEGGDD